MLYKNKLGERTLKDFMDYVGWFISTGLLLLVIYVIKKIPDMVSDKLKNVREHEFNKELQVDEYYRKDGNLQQIMMKWTHYAIDKNAMDNISTKSGQKELQELVKKTVGYGSSRTVKLLTEMFQSVYQNSNDGEADNSLESGYTTMILMSMIVSSLKEDFTGHKIDPLDVLKIKITDYTDNEEAFESILNRINEKLGVKV